MHALLEIIRRPKQSHSIIKNRKCHFFSVALFVAKRCLVKFNWLLCFHVLSFLLIVCRDNDYRCSSWARRGECQRNPRYMRLNCKRSCRLCGNYHSRNGNGPKHSTNWLAAVEISVYLDRRLASNLRNLSAIPLQIHLPAFFKCILNCPQGQRDRTRHLLRNAKKVLSLARDKTPSERKNVRKRTISLGWISTIASNLRA